MGPPLGGFLTDHFGWRSIFLVNLPIGIAVAACGYLLLPRHEARRRAGHAPRPPRDRSLGALTLVCLLVPLTFAAQWGWTSPRTLGLLAVAAVGLAAFIFVERRAADPLLDLDLLFHNRLFAAANTAALLNYMALGAITHPDGGLPRGRAGALGGPHRLADARRAGRDGRPEPLQRTPERQGRLAAARQRRHGHRGARHAAAGDDADLLGARCGSWPVSAVVGLGMAAFSAPNMSAIMGSVEKRQLGLASAFVGTMRVTGQALSVAVLGGIAASTLGPAGGRLLLTLGTPVPGQSRAAALAAAAYRAASLRARLPLRDVDGRRARPRRARSPR